MLKKKTSYKFIKKAASIILAMGVILTSMAGMSLNTVSAQADNVLWVGSHLDGAWFGQQVALEEGKTYEFSYYYTAGANFYPNIYKNLSEGVISSTKTEDGNYFKTTAKFTVPADALDDGNGKKLVWVGIRTGSARSQYEYVYKFNLNSTENPQVNLLNDAGLEIQGDYDVNKNVWKSAYGDSVWYGFWARAASEIGGMTAFTRTDNNKHVIKVASGISWKFFGQQVALEEGKTYEFSCNYSSSLEFYMATHKNMSEDEISGVVTTDDTNSFKKTARFTVPADALDGPDGKKLVYVGIRAIGSWPYDSYLYNFNVYNVENPSVNLFSDPYLFDDGFSINGNKWKAPWNLAVDGGFSETSLASVGGEDIFVKDDNTAHVLKADKEISWKFFGQQVALEAGKTYDLSLLHSSGADFYLVADKNMNEAGIGGVVTTVDPQSLKKTARFTVPDDALDGPDGKKLVYLGIRVLSAPEGGSYFYNFNVNNIENPTVNLFEDAYFFDNQFNINGNKWKAPWNVAVDSKFSEVSLASIGGKQAFVRGDADKHVLKLDNSLSWEFFGQQVALDAGKTYEFSTYYSKGLEFYPSVFKDTAETSIDNVKSEDPENLRRITRFTVPNDATDGPNGKKLVWVGIRTAGPRTQTGYFYNFNVYDVENPTVNLFGDPYWFDNGFDVNRNLWKKMWNLASESGFTEATLASIGGMDSFIRPAISITYDTLSETGTFVEQATAGIAFNAPIAPTKSGYVFGGWYTDTNYSTKWNFAQNTANNDITLVARWLLLGDTDTNGTINVIDLMRIKKHIAGMDQLTGDNLLAAKISGNETVVTEDMVLLRKKLLG